ncbi:MAG: hypothetical protein LBB09_03280 [Rickettsiales bacterium]|jgi:glycine cleavage system H protein|nr:hypothetical protein [Rickettsiales bacterium]
MEEIFYTREHFWVYVEGDIATIGLTDYVLDNFSMISFVNLPQISSVCDKTELIGNIVYNEDEVFEIFSPFSGEIVEVNDLVLDNPEQLFNNVKGNNWLLRIFMSDHGEIKDLISKEEYEEYAEEL